METSTLVKQLASNSRITRENALNSLKKYLITRNLKTNKQSQFDKLWKGLYFAMWFSDKPRPQQILANELGELHLLYLNDSDDQLSYKSFLKFSKSFWRVMCFEWYNIDHHRLDKFLLLVRRVLFNQLKFLKKNNWNELLVDLYIENVLKQLPLSGDKKIYNGIPFHIIDIFIDEWEKLMFESCEEDMISHEDKVAKLMQSTPLSKFLKIFQDLAANLNNMKTLRKKIEEDILCDARLLKWGVVCKDIDEEEEEWNGF